MFEFDPYSREYTQNPYPIYTRLRDEAPVYHNERMGFWALSRYDDVVNAHLDAATFSSASGVTIEGTEAAMPFLIVKDQPEHRWAKGLVMKMFSPQRMNELDIFIRRRVVELLDGIYERHGPDGSFNFVAEFSVQLPLGVISELLGIPEELREEIHQLSNQIVYRGEDADPQLAAAANERMRELYMDLARERRASPRDDVVSMLIAETVKDEAGETHRMDDFEIGVRFLEMGFAGHETVAKAIPNGTMAFHANPDQWEMLRATPTSMEKTVAEILRYDPPSQLQGRTTTRPVELHGVTIPEGVRVMLITGSATHDPRAFPDPDRFDITREVDSRSIYFGYGVHKCLGMHLARREITIAFEELVARFPRLSVEPEKATRAILSNVRGVSSLPARFGERALT